MAMPLYTPAGVEERWQGAWEEDGLYRAGAGKRREETFVICVPPPNVTGALHMGHALNGTLQDVLVRWHRMQGYDTLWQPGYDHAGISTQNVVEKQLIERGRRARSSDVTRSWSASGGTWRRPGDDHGSVPTAGARSTTKRERFTMDDAYIEAVMRFSPTSGTAAGSTGRTGSSTGARTTRPRS